MMNLRGSQTFSWQGPPKRYVLYEVRCSSDQILSQGPASKKLTLVIRISLLIHYLNALMNNNGVNSSFSWGPPGIPSSTPGGPWTPFCE